MPSSGPLTPGCGAGPSTPRANPSLETRPEPTGRATPCQRKRRALAQMSETRTDLEKVNIKANAAAT